MGTENQLFQTKLLGLLDDIARLNREDEDELQKIDDKIREYSKERDLMEKTPEEILKKVEFLTFKQEYEEALELLEPLVKMADDDPMYQDNDEIVYHSFDSFFEVLLYDMLYEPEREMKDVSFPASEIYLRYGALLFELEQYDAAGEALEQAHLWNPTSVKIAAEYAEVFKKRGDMEKFDELTREMFLYAYEPEDLARCYRNLGYYFIEVENYDAAMACYQLSSLYDSDSKQLEDELSFMEDELGVELREMEVEELEKFCDQYNFPLGPDEDVLELAWSCAKMAMEDEENNLARYFLAIICDLTEDEEAVEMLEGLWE